MPDNVSLLSLKEQRTEPANYEQVGIYMYMYIDDMYTPEAWF